jgi:ABC-2 type transport system permease protein
LTVLAPGSIPWLLAHELRLAFRARSKRQGQTLVVVIAVAALLTLVAGVPLALFLRQMPIRQSPGLLLTFDLILLAVFTLILSQTLASAVIGFYERGDLDLLLSSPLPPRRTLTVRAIAIAVTPLLWFGSLVSILVLPAAVLGQPRWLTAYPVLIALAMLASAAGMSLAMALFGLIGARRTRTVGQLLAALIGAGFFLFGQMRNLLPDHGRQLFAGVMRWADGGAFAPGSPLSWPARAVLGDLLPLAALVGGSAILFAAVVVGLGRRFASNASLAAGVSAGPARSPGRRPSLQGFEGGLDGALIRKELRLLLRDPTLLSQVLLRALYVLPLAFLLVRNAAEPDRFTAFIATGGAMALSLAVVFAAGQLAGSLAWIVICAEDAPELLACAPVDGGRVRRAKLWAAMIPVAALLGPLLLALAWFSPRIGVCAAAGAAASAVSAGLINLWFEKPASRKAFRGRRTGSILVGVVEAFVGLGWGVTAGIAASGWLWFLALVPLAVTLGLMAVARALAKPTRGY